MIWKKDEQADPVATQGVRSVVEETGGEVTIVGAQAKLEGTVISAGSLRIDGRVSGEIKADGDVMLTETSKVEADLKAKNVVVAGSFVGDIAVQGSAEVTRTGRVQGDITSKTLVIQEGGVFIGESKMESSAPASASDANKSAVGAAAEPAAANPEDGSTPPAEKAKAGS